MKICKINQISKFEKLISILQFYFVKNSILNTIYKNLLKNWKYFTFTYHNHDYKDLPAVYFSYNDRSLLIHYLDQGHLWLDTE